MPRTSLAWFLSLAILGLLASSLASQEASKPQAQPPAESKPDAKAESEADSKAEAGGDSKAQADADGKGEPKGDSKDEAKAPQPQILLPQMLVIGKIDALCASDQFLVKIRPISPLYPGEHPCPPWLLVSSKKTPQASSLLQKAAEEDWTVAVYYDPTWTVTAVCVRFLPEVNDD